MGKPSSIDSGHRILRVVALASRTGRYGGPFDTAIRQVTELRKEHLDARLLSSYLKGDAPDARQLVTGHYVKARKLLPARGFISIFSVRLAIAAAREIYRSSVVHVSFAREPLPVWTAALAIALRRRLVLQPHGMLTSRSTFAHRFVDRVIMRPLYVHASAAIALTHVEAHELALWAETPPPTTILGNPVPPRALHLSRQREQPCEDQVRIVFVARLHRRKRVVDFIAASEIARANRKKWLWVVVGPDEGQLESVETAARSNTKLVYTGAVPSAAVVDHLDESSIYVMPSENEPWGNVLASAVAMGLPVVVTESAALASSIAEHSAGRVIPDHNPPAIYGAIVDLLSEDNYMRASAGTLRMKVAMLDPAMQRTELILAVLGEPLNE